MRVLIGAYLKILFSVKYHYIEEVVNMTLNLGTTTWGAHIDIQHAFRNEPIHLEDLHLLGLTLNGKLLH